MNTKGEATKAEGMKLESVNDDDDDDDLVARMGQISLSDDYQQMLAVAKECVRFFSSVAYCCCCCF